MTTKKIHEIMRKLSRQRPVFHSEADFQHALAWQIQKEIKSANVRLEVPFAALGMETREHLDILVETDSVETAIELKYKTVKLSPPAKSFELSNSGAHRNNRILFWKDVPRVEKFGTRKSKRRGYVILLTNDSQYWREIHSSYQRSDDAFRMHDTWRVNKGRLCKLGEQKAEAVIKGSYKCNWVHYSDCHKPDFRYLMLQIPVGLRRP